MTTSQHEQYLMQLNLNQPSFIQLFTRVLFHRDASKYHLSQIILTVDPLNPNFEENQQTLKTFIFLTSSSDFHWEQLSGGRLPHN